MPHAGSEASLRRVADCCLADLWAEHPLPYRPTLVWKSLRVSAGLAHYTKRQITLSLVLLTSEERVLSTLIHEYAHLLAVARHGRRAAGHGPEWRQAMADLGQPATVRHAYEVVRNVPRQRVAYRCARCGATFQRHRRFPRGRSYVHVDCGGRLVFAGSQAITAPPAAP